MEVTRENPRQAFGGRGPNRKRLFELLTKNVSEPYFKPLAKKTLPESWTSMTTWLRTKLDKDDVKDGDLTRGVKYASRVLRDDLADQSGLTKAAFRVWTSRGGNEYHAGIIYCIVAREDIGRDELPYLSENGQE